MQRIAIVCFLGLVACGGEEPKEEPKAEEPKAEEPAKVEEPKEEKVDLAAMSPEDQKAWLMKKGEEVYTTGGSGGVACVTCHMADGKGVAQAFPPLAGQLALMGDCKKHAGVVVHGLSGEITVDGVVYNGNMPAQGNLTDEEIAAVITYERNSFGNAGDVCLPAQVAEARTAPAPTAADFK